MALGPYHLAVGMNNRAWFYMFGEKGKWRQAVYVSYFGFVRLVDFLKYCLHRRILE